MARQRRQRFDEEDGHAGHERWLISYADFITLLFAFFVVMYALSSVNEGKYRVLSHSLLNAFGRGPVLAPRPDAGKSPAADVPVVPAIPPRDAGTLQREKERLTRVARNIADVLAPLVRQGKVRVTQTERGVDVEINDSVLFAPGDASLSDTSVQALSAVAEVLKGDDHAIQVEGHTDSVPIRTALYPSNWELSAVRASSVVRLLIDKGIAASRLTAVGHGSTRPVDANDTVEGRLRNRRVSVLVLSRLPEERTEVPVR